MFNPFFEAYTNTIRSERLLFRKLNLDDIESWIDFFYQNKNLAYLGIDTKREAKILAQEWIEKQIERYQTQGFGHLAVIEKETQNFIGMGGILPREIEGESFFEIAYSLKPSHWNLGFGTEIAQTIKDFGFNFKISNRFISIIHIDNHASSNIAVKNGMTLWQNSIYLGMPVHIFAIEKK